jgi:hypothetical protein
MKRLSILAILIISPATFAETPAANDSSPERSAELASAEALVHSELLEPLVAKEVGRGRFSRGRLPAQERRVRLLDEQARTDTRGDAFVTFAVDARHGYRSGDESQWRKATITGCVYPGSSKVFVKKGTQYRPAAFLLGKNLKAAAAGTCEAGPAQLAHAN